MSTRWTAAVMASIGELRHEPVPKRVRATIGESTVVDTTRPVLVWEPRRVVPSYAVPEDDVAAELLAAGAARPGDGDDVGHRLDAPGLAGRLVLDPSIPFSVHTAAGESLSVRARSETRHAVAFRPADPDLAGHVVLDFDGFDAWYDEDERVLAHPRDPYHRMEILPSSRPVRIELDGELLAETSSARLLLEGTLLPVRPYIPREDVRVPLSPSARRSRCAYKGEASYWSAQLAGRMLEDIAWTYEAPLREAEPVRGLVAFFGERVDVVIGGERLPRPLTPWS